MSIINRLNALYDDNIDIKSSNVFRRIQRVCLQKDANVKQSGNPPNYVIRKNCLFDWASAYIFGVQSTHPLYQLIPRYIRG